MATINLGAIKFKWQGAYNAGTAYTVDDVVSYNGSSYICILASTGNLPTNATYWEQMSSAGTNGTDGTDLTTTLTTQGDIVYRDASGLARLGAGTSGHALVTKGSGQNPVWEAVGVSGIDSSADATAITINSTEQVSIGTSTISGNAIFNVEGNLGSPLVRWYDKRSTATVDVFSIYSDVSSTENRTFLIEANGDVFNLNNSYGSLSDRKFKENETDASSQWNDIKALQIKNYNLKTSPDKQLLGVIAQDLETSGMNGLVTNKPDELYTENDVLPEGKNVGDIKEEGYKEVKYSVLYMKSVKALQEAMERIETLEAKVTALTGDTPPVE